jgi:hypothetical protein
MSLAFYAAPINNNNDNDNNNSGNSSVIERKRNVRANHNKTVKRYGGSDDKIENMKKQIGFDSMDSSDQHMADFSPPSPPESAGVQRTRDRDNHGDNVVQPHPASMHNDSPVSTEAFQNLPSLASEDYYRQYVPYYDRTGQGSPSQDELISKLDYMIHLLEQQRELKTGSATEEVILYSFLGVFMIFVLDSFARAGKYTR